MCHSNRYAPPQHAGGSTSASASASASSSASGNGVSASRDGRSISPAFLLQEYVQEMELSTNQVWRHLASQIRRVTSGDGIQPGDMKSTEFLVTHKLCRDLIVSL